MPDLVELLTYYVIVAVVFVGAPAVFLTIVFMPALMNTKGAVVGYKLMESPMGMGLGAGLAGGIVKGNYNITNSSGTSSDDWNLMEHVKAIPWLCAARIGGLTYLVYSWYRPGNTELTNVGLSGFVAGLSEFFVPDNRANII